jgi:porin
MFDQAVSVKENFEEKYIMDKFKPFLMMIVFTVTTIILSAPVQTFAQLPTPDYSGDLWTRSTLTGDWGGARNELARKGIVFKASVTEIYQGNFTDGSNGDEYWRNSGTVDYEMDLDFGKLGLWPGGFLKVRGMSNYRKSINSVAGSIMPVNSDALFPWPNGNYTGLTDFLFMQFLSEHFGLLAGKTNTLEGGDINEFAHDYKTQFLNTAFIINPVTLRTCPYSSVAIGAVFHNKVAEFNLNVMDTEGSAIKSGYKTVMHNGTTVASQLRFKTCIAGLPGHQLFGGTWSNATFNNLNQDPRTILSQILLPNRDIPLKTYKDSWSFFYNMDHYLYLKEGSTDQGFGVFARYGVSDGKANPIKYFASFGIGGKGMIPGRCQDTFGIGYYHVWFTDNLSSTVKKNLLHNEQGGELYYNIYLTPWVQLTPDLQIIESGNKRVDNTVIVGGLRMQLNF